MDFQELPPISPIGFYGKRYRTLVLASYVPLVASSTHKDVSSVGVFPPETDYQTDNEDIDEDNLQTQSFPNNLLGEIQVHYMSDDSDKDEEDNLPLAIGRENLPKGQNKTKKSDWKEEITDISMTSTTGYEGRLGYFI
ncbi:uncharacterized protein [Diabrotica undecimpunctata]|uniref:uncharacterized protein n=1 Tax=Diabrotica undecimpunctata TaxID=50387 RepID=UPI003B63991A